MAAVADEATGRAMDRITDGVADEAMSGITDGIADEAMSWPLWWRRSRKTY